MTNPTLSHFLVFQAPEIIETSDSDNLTKPSYMNQGWNLKELEKLIAPQIMGFLYGEEKQKFSMPQTQCLNIQNLEIKSPGDLNYRLPKELENFEATIKKIAAYENRINSNILNYYAYLSIEQKEVWPETHKKRPLHLYDYENQQKEVEVSHSYLVYDKAPPLFLRQKFRVGYNWKPEKHNYMLGFERQADSENKIYCDPYSILLVSPYEPYEEGITYTEGVRTQLRVLYSITSRDKNIFVPSNLPAPPDITQDDIVAAELIAKFEKDKLRAAQKKKKVKVEKIGSVD